MAAQDVSENRRAIDRSGERGGSISLVLAVALLLVGSVIALLFIGRANAQPYILTLLSALAVIGVFSLFAGAAGILRLAGRETKDTFLDALPATAPDGIVVTDQNGRLVYANPAYLKLVDAVDADDVRPVERVFVGDPQVSEAIYRLAKASREGRPLQEEVRVPAADGGEVRWLRFRVRPLQEAGAYARWTTWTVGDVTRDRARQEDFFVELRDAIDFLDHAPVGFFSVDPKGKVGYINATLAELARLRSRAGRFRRSQGHRPRAGRSRRAARADAGRAGERQDRRSRHRSQDARRPHRADAALS